ncbi:hypothetical protein GE300_08420 [Rhodobacteraceae bacterium 2CG4]|uniref:TVP38/TMEM64 family membrane protein n=1 Tax=Halovulum marinum TaxID=2662447 RepID=A0A6L5Z0M2_9RHOB|nr:hypothetical protein [Halovulum marinum]MSU89640.1 hypothetical protein [Halovulum marinum]
MTRRAPCANAAPRPSRTAAGMALRLLLALAVVVALNLTLGAWLRGIEQQLRPETLESLRRGIWVTCLLYALLLAVPFVPGVEIGLAMLGMFGAAVAPHVYLATVGGMTLAFAAGRLIPLPALARLAGRLRMTRAEARLQALAALPPDALTRVLIAEAPGRLAPLLLRRRHIALALLVNLPGNGLIGGGGGIGLVAGLSRVYSVAGFVLTIVIAVAPVPLAVWLFGTRVLPGF